jgi:hypothetical protein
MTRITTQTQKNNVKNTVSVLMDIIEMGKSTLPLREELDSLLETVGTHGSIIEDAVVYEDEGVCHVHTKKIMSDLTKNF